MIGRETKQSVTVCRTRSVTVLQVRANFHFDARSTLIDDRQFHSGRSAWYARQIPPETTRDYFGKRAVSINAFSSFT